MMSMIEKVRSVLITPVEDIISFTGNLRGWLARQQRIGKVTWLLAYADDGVIWGQVVNGTLTLATDVFENCSAELDIVTLQRLYLFGENAEIHIWKDGETFFGQRLEDGPDAEVESYDQELVLWGTRIYAGPKQGFTLMEDGSQGLRHAVPLEVLASRLSKDQTAGPLVRPLRLGVRQYLDYDNDGQAFVTAVRLVNLRVR